MKRLFVSNSSMLLYRSIAIILALSFLAVSSSSPVYALSATQQKIFRYQIYTYDDQVGAGCAVAAAAAGAVGTVSTSKDEEANAKIVIGIAKTNNLGKAGALIGLMVGITESTLTIYANSNVPLSLTLPHQAVGSDHDSLGIMQQRISTDWSTISSNPNDANAVKQLMDPAYNAEAFFGSPTGSNAPRQLSKGLQNVSGWQSMSPWVAAQKVQASGTPDGSNYKARLSDAQALLNKLWDSSPPVALPVPLAKGAGQTSTTSAGSGSGCSDTASTVNCNQGATAATSSNTRQQVLCITQAEYKLWQTGAIKPGTGYYKYSQNRPENWCADFASWVYNQAKYPIDPAAKDGNVPAVSTIKSIGEQNKLFHYHDAQSYIPRPGDLAIHFAGGYTSHVNIVTAVKGTEITLIGGNQAGNGGGFSNSKVTQYTTNNPASDGIGGYVSPD